MSVEEPARRTGGRSARVRAQVHRAVTELLAERRSAITVPEVAARAGVHPTSLYRRWGTIEALILDVAVSRLTEESPVPDTGELRADLLTYAQRVAGDLKQPDRLAFLRTVLAVSDASDPRNDPRAPLLGARGAQIQVMLDRAAQHGEASLHYTDVLDGILAPIYLRSLFDVGGVDDAYLTRLVDHLLAFHRRGEEAAAAPGEVRVVEPGIDSGGPGSERPRKPKPGVPQAETLGSGGNRCT
jgi:AcrR family transcriptional regulator